MRLITYSILFQCPTDLHRVKVEVRARDLNSGAPKALKIGLRGVPKDWEFCSLTFEQAS